MNFHRRNRECHRNTALQEPSHFAAHSLPLPFIRSLAGPQRLLLPMAAWQKTGDCLIGVIRSAKILTSPMAAFRPVAVQAVLGMLEVRCLAPRVGAVDP